jgi:hypothetical protein
VTDYERGVVAALKLATAYCHDTLRYILRPEQLALLEADLTALRERIVPPVEPPKDPM